MEGGPTFSIFSMLQAQGTTERLLGTLPMLILAAGLWYLESRKRGERAVEAPHTELCTPDSGRVLRQCAPEVAGLAGCLTVAIVLLLRGDSWTPTNPSDLESWNQIKAAWPLLTTADSLIALQAMLRIAPLLSVLLRPCAAGTLAATSFAGGPAVFGLGASACRVLLFFLSPYHRLDGPLSGWVHGVFEVAAIPPLLVLSRGAFRQAQLVIATAVAFLAFSWVASRHRLALADDNPDLDTIFTLAELLELGTAVTYLARTVAANGGPSGIASSFMHVLLPVQQALPMYYFLVAFKDEAGLAAVGRPLTLLQISSSVQVGVYIMAAVLHLTLWVETQDKDRVHL